jgi:two-component system chemotaxis response regulator CheB
MPDAMEKMPQIVAQDMQDQEKGSRRGDVSVFSCPECGGALWQVDEKELVRFRCHVDHAYYAEALLTEQADGLEAALWTAVRIFKERVVLARQLAVQEKEAGKAESAARFEDQATVAERYGSLIQQYLLQPGPPPGGTKEEDVPPP